MAKTAINRPQQVDGAQWRLTWVGTDRADVVTASVGNTSYRLTPTIRDETLSAFMRNDGPTFLVDLSRASSTVSRIEFVIEVTAAGDRSWRMESLTTPEIWESAPCLISADSPTMLLAFERGATGWIISAHEKPVGAVADVEIDSSVPAEYRELVTFASSRDLAGDAEHFACIIDLTASMRDHLASDAFPNLLAALVAVASTSNNRPLDVSYHGVLDSRLTMDTDIPAEHRARYDESIAKVGNARPLHALVKHTAGSIRANSRLYVVTDGFVFVDDEVERIAAAKNCRVELLHLGDPADSQKLPSTYASIAAKQIGDVALLSPKGVLELLSAGDAAN